MSCEFPSLAEILREHDFSGCGSCPDDSESRHSLVSSARGCEHLEAVWREACTVTTVEQLDALPDRAVILDVDGGVIRRNPWHSEDPGNWYPLDGYDAYTRDFGIAAEDVPLPARVIHNPDWSTT